MKNLNEFESLSKGEARSVNGGAWNWVLSVGIWVMKNRENYMEYYDAAYACEPGGGRCHI